MCGEEPFRMTLSPPRFKPRSLQHTACQRHAADAAGGRLGLPRMPGLERGAEHVLRVLRPVFIAFSAVSHGVLEALSSKDPTFLHVSRVYSC